VGRYRFLTRPRWVLFTAVMLGLVVAMINLSLWQLRRLHERRSMNADITAALHAAPVDVTTPVPVSEWRMLTATGSYDPTHEVLIRNRSYQGQPGFHVVTPLKLADGRALLVNRGWIPLTKDGSTPIPPAPPTEPVVVTGRARASQRRGAFFSPRDPPEGTLRQLYRLDVPRIAQQTPYALVDDYVELLTTTPAPAGPQPVLIPPPELDDGPHLSYAFQWLFFSGCVVAGWILVVRRTAKQLAKRAAQAAHAEPAVPADQATRASSTEHEATADTPW
jgi:cytochrome oxidase assembly protein ShyY1